MWQNTVVVFGYIMFTIGMSFAVVGIGRIIVDFGRSM